jgi:hypothetical protein
MPRYRRVALRLFGAGAVLALLGVVGMIAGVGEEVSRVSATEPGPHSVTNEPLSDGPETFALALGKAERDGDVDFRVERLHPAVIERYGEAACRADLDGPPDPTVRFEEPVVDRVGSWDYTSDGETVTIEETFFVNAERYGGGEPGRDVVLHFAEAEGLLRWFTDCTDTDGSERLRVAAAHRGVAVGAVRLDRVVAVRRVHPHRLGLLGTRLEDEARVAEVPRGRFERAQHSQRDASASRCRAHVHPLELGRLVVDTAKSAAPDRGVVGPGNEEGAVRGRDLRRSEVVELVVRVELILHAVALEQLDEEAGRELGSDRRVESVGDQPNIVRHCSRVGKRNT